MTKTSSITVTDSAASSPPVSTVDLESVQDSKIISVALYSGRAEITRLFKFNVKAGQNLLNIKALPRALDQESFRVEGRGAATIHDVTISTIPTPEKSKTSPKLQELQRKQVISNKALERAKRSLSSLEKYLSSVHPEHVGVGQLNEVVKNYDTTAGELDDQVTKLEKEIEEVQKAIAAEAEHLAGPTQNEKLNLKASIGVFAEFDGEIKIALIYAVRNATWTAGYDVRVDMQAKEKSVTLFYKASITQDTGEDWNDVPLTLETATPTFGIGVPTLQPWTLSVNRPQYNYRYRSSGSGLVSSSVMPMAMSAAPARKRAMFDEVETCAESEVDDMPVQHRGLLVSSKGNISATFGVPGLINIPSDNVAHSVTIVKLSLDATMSWLSVPKKDSRVHLKAKIKNASEYTLLPGNSSVYVDGSFISKSTVPLVSPQESFDCPLGLDPSVRITYHPRSKKASFTGFYNKNVVYTYTQRITVHNTKASSSGTDALKVKVVDQFPISEDSTITVKHVQPALALPDAENTTTGTISSALTSSEVKLPPPVKVSLGVVATWDGADELSLGSVQSPSDVDVDALAKEGKFCWICSIAPQGKANLTMQWEVSAPVKTDIAGL